jgi:hypothetical protein
LVRLLREVADQCRLCRCGLHSSHSLRRGFASWANDQGWDMKALMEYVGWRDVQSAMRYLDGRDPFARDRIEASLPSPTAPVPAMALPAPEGKSALQLRLRMVLTPLPARAAARPRPEAGSKRSAWPRSRLCA